MAEHSERNTSHVRGRIVGVVAGILRWVGTLIAVVLTLHVVLTVFGANQDNAITKFVGAWAGPLSLAFHDLFVPQDDKLRVLADYGLAAVFWLIVTTILVKLIRRLG